MGLVSSGSVTHRALDPDWLSGLNHFFNQGLKVEFSSQIMSQNFIFEPKIIELLLFRLFRVENRLFLEVWQWRRR